VYSDSEFHEQHERNRAGQEYLQCERHPPESRFVVSDEHLHDFLQVIESLFECLSAIVGELRIPPAITGSFSHQALSDMAILAQTPEPTSYGESPPPPPEPPPLPPEELRNTVYQGHVLFILSNPQRWATSFDDD